MPISVLHHGDDAPSGENLEYDTLFTDLLLAAQPEEERQSGDEIIPGRDPDPAPVIAAAEAVLARSNDIRAALLYGNARLRTEGLPGLAEVTGYLRTCMQEYWDSFHPQLDADDDDDPTMRVNAMLALVDKQGTLRALRLAPLTDSPAFGRYGLRDFAIAAGEIAAPADMDSPPTQQAVAAALQDTPTARHERNNEAIAAALADIKAINAIFDERLPGQGPSLNDLTVLLRKAATIIAPHVAAPAEAASSDQAGPAVAPGQSSAAAPAAPGTIATPEDVRKAIDRIIEYYARHEPSSPLPIILERARRLVGADFMTIVQDLAPQGVDNVRLVGGMENPE